MSKSFSINSIYSSKSSYSTLFSSSKKHKISWNEKAKKNEKIEKLNHKEEIELDFSLMTKEYFVKKRSMDVYPYDNLRLNSYCVETSFEKEIEDEYNEAYDNEISLYDIDFNENLKILGYTNFQTKDSYYELRLFHQLRYISKKTAIYYFGTEDVSGIPDWAILARLAGITPGNISEFANISKKLALKLFNQFSFNWVSCYPSKLEESFEFHVEEPVFVYARKAFGEKFSRKLKGMKTLKVKEKVVENGETYYFDSFQERIEKALRHLLLNGITQKTWMPSSNNAKDLALELEGYFYSEEAKANFSILPDKEIEISTSTPKQIYKIGVENGNCLRASAKSWKTENGMIIKFKNGIICHLKLYNGKIKIYEALKSFNRALSKTEKNFLNNYFSLT